MYVKNNVTDVAQKLKARLFRGDVGKIAEIAACSVSRVRGTFSGRFHNVDPDIIDAAVKVIGDRQARESAALDNASKVL